MVLAERLQIPLRDRPHSGATDAYGDETPTFAELVEQYDRTVHNVVRSLVHNPQDVDDVSQEVWIKVANNLANLRDETRFLPWLYRISRNCALSFLSTQKTRQQVANTDEDDLVEALVSPLADGPEAQAISVVERREVWAALAELSEADRTVLLLREFHELPYADIARQLNISRGNAEVRVFRARSRFRQQFVKREGAMARGFLGMPLFGLLGKLKLLFGATSVVSAPASATVTASVATGVTAVGATTGAGVAAEVGVSIVAKIAITAAALSMAAGAVSIAAPEVAPILDGSADRGPSLVEQMPPAASPALVSSVGSSAAIAPSRGNASAPSSVVPAQATSKSEPASAASAVLASRQTQAGVGPSLVAIVGPAAGSGVAPTAGSGVAPTAGSVFAPVPVDAVGAPFEVPWAPTFGLPVDVLPSPAVNSTPIGASPTSAAPSTTGGSQNRAGGANAASGPVGNSSADATPGSHTDAPSNQGGQDKADAPDHGSSAASNAAGSVGHGEQGKALGSDHTSDGPSTAGNSGEHSGQDKSPAAPQAAANDHGASPEKSESHGQDEGSGSDHGKPSGEASHHGERH